MRGLSLLQPYCSLLALGEKRIETRSWCTSYRGRVAIHASRRFPRRLRDLCDYGGQFYQDMAPHFVFAGRVEGKEEPVRMIPATISDLLPLGAIIAVGFLAEVITTERALTACPLPVIGTRLSEKERRMGDYSPGRFAWIFRDMVQLPEPVRCQGRLGLWELGANVTVQVHEQIKRLQNRVET